MIDIIKVRELYRKYMIENPKSFAVYARELNICRESMNDFMSGTKKTRLGTMVRILSFLKSKGIE